MSVKRSGLAAAQGAIVVAQTKALGLPELRYVQNAMADVAPDWSAELAGICSEEATLVLLPENGDDATGPSFVISRESFGYRLDQVHWDMMHEIGVYPSLLDVMTVIQVHVGFTSLLQNADTHTVH